MNLTDYLSAISLYPGETSRDDCPRCQKENTFTATNMGAYILYNCYHADCNLSGKIQDNINKRSFKDSNSKVIKEEFNVNNHFFVDINRSEKAVNYLKRVNCFAAYTEGRTKVVYDIKQDRAVFLIFKNKQIIDACGRKLGRYGAKWHRYGSTKLPFIVQSKQNSRTAVVVEDCASACSVSDLYNGVALLGTHLTEQSLCDIRQFDEAIVCLDKDASMKSIKIAQQIKPYVPAKVKVLETDLKNLSNSEIEEFFNCD